MEVDMGGRRRAGLMLWLALSVPGCAPAPVPEAPAPPLEGFAWLVGCWQSRDGMVERWEAPEGAAMTGANLIPELDGTQVQQSLRISSTERGAVAFYAQAPGQSPLAYPLVTLEETRAVFENPAHTVSQRISYRRDGERLVATLYSSLEADARGWETQYTPCSGDLPPP